jgi:hypothetical protein
MGQHDTPILRRKDGSIDYSRYQARASQLRGEAIRTAAARCFHAVMTRGWHDLKGDRPVRAPQTP